MHILLVGTGEQIQGGFGIRQFRPCGNCHGYGR